MDSMMIKSNIRKMRRLELLYTCLPNLVKELHHNGITQMPPTGKKPRKRIENTLLILQEPLMKKILLSPITSIYQHQKRRFLYP